MTLCFIFYFAPAIAFFVKKRSYVLNVDFLRARKGSAPGLASNIKRI